ncbi:MAG: helix-turn-helix transcriptional regulator [Butyricicoccus sp.]|nr:helix-turn-helix transcriptional regulator [Butyricicoccus sp.]
MPREKFQTLTEQMFYILLCLREPCCGTDIMEQVRALTGGRVTVGPGTLYHLLDSFVGAGMIEEIDTGSRGRKRSYRLTAAGKTALRQEYDRLQTLAADYRECFGEEVHR